MASPVRVRFSGAMASPDDDGDDEDDDGDEENEEKDTSNPRSEEGDWTAKPTMGAAGVLKRNVMANKFVAQKYLKEFNLAGEANARKSVARQTIMARHSK